MALLALWFIFNKYNDWEFIMAVQKKFDIVLFGATGFTGTLTAEYLAKAMQRESFTWAIAGRNQAKLNKLKKRLESINPACRVNVSCIAANIEDASSLVLMAKSARVVITTVGPYALYGEPLVKACVENNADYVDLTGEPEFVANMEEKYGELAEENKLRIVNCCGFDSIPHDLGVMFTVDLLTKGLSKRQAAEQKIKVEGFVRAGGRFSGGTWHSAIHAFSRFRSFSQQKRSFKRPSPSQRRINEIPLKVSFRPELGVWGCPFPSIDPQVVKHSARLLSQYGQQFEYGHYIQVKKLPRLIAGVSFVGGVFALSQFNLTKKLLLNIKKQGDGPTLQERKKGWFKVVFMGQMGHRKVKTVVRGGDPGYEETSKMLAESALCLALDRRRLPRITGVITPAAAMGKPLMKRLVAAGIRFDVLSERD